MNRTSTAYAQVRTGNAKSRKLYGRERLSLQLKLRKLYRLLTGGVWNDFSITDDALGRIVLIYLRALGIDDEIADRIAPWADMSEIDKVAAHIKLTRENVGEVIGRGIGLTYEQRETHKAWAFWPCDKTRDEVQRLNDKKRNKKKRDKRTKRKAQIEVMPRPRKQVAVYAAFDRLSRQRGCRLPMTVSDIIDNIKKHERWTAKSRAVRHCLDHLERDGLLRTHRCKFGGPRRISRDLRALMEPMEPPAVVPEQWELDGVSRRTWFRHRAKARQNSRGTGSAPRRVPVPPVFQPQALDEAIVSVPGATENRMAHLYVGEPLSKTTHTGADGTISKGLSKEVRTPRLGDQPQQHAELMASVGVDGEGHCIDHGDSLPGGEIKTLIRMDTLAADLPDHEPQRAVLVKGGPVEHARASPDGSTASAMSVVDEPGTPSPTLVGACPPLGRVDEVDQVTGGTSTIEFGNPSLNMEEQDMKRLTREQREQVRLEMAYLRQRMAALEELLRDDDDEQRPDDRGEPSHRTVQ